MCEILALRTEQPFSLLEVVPYAGLMEKYGLAGWGWGVSWIDSSGIETYKSLGQVNQLTRDETSVLETKTKACLFHLRRPSFLSSMRIENTQPFSPDSKHLSFVHNGFLAEAETLRSQLSFELTGSVDSEIGFRLYMRYLNSCNVTMALARTLDETRGDGDANVVILNTDGSFVAAGRNSKNRMFRFESARFTGILTEVHSPDDYVFNALLPWIERKEQITEPIHF